MADLQPVLPKFKNPPLSEVAVGVQFGSPHLTPIHLGLYYQRVKTRFPATQVHPPLPPAFETFGPSPTLSFAKVGGLTPRMWFVDDNGTSLIQLQTGRLLFNWRRGGEQGRYPHFHAVRSEFQFALNELAALSSGEGLGEIVVQQCELVYVNSLPAVETGIPLSAPDALFRTWSAKVGAEWQEQIEDAAFNVRYRLDSAAGEPFGRLTVAVTAGLGPAGDPGFQLELTARGKPLGSGEDGIAAFLDHAHEAIVRCFAGLTTPAMHERWERYQ